MEIAALGSGSELAEREHSPPGNGRKNHGMVWQENIDSGLSSFQLDDRPGCRYCNLSHLPALSGPRLIPLIGTEPV
jgi:hypothetical protein